MFIDWGFESLLITGNHIGDPLYPYDCLLLKKYLGATSSFPSKTTTLRKNISHE